jgi:hypothetical protein
MKLYIVQGYSYEEQYVVCIMHDKGSAIEFGRKLAKKYKEGCKDNPTRRAYWFCVLEAETQTTYYPGIPDINNMTPQVWDEHDDLDND